MAVSFVRTIILYILIVIAMRIMGKRQMGELEPTELVVAVLISDLAANPLQDMGIPLLYGLIPVITLIACEILVTGIVMKNIHWRGIICGKPSFIIKNGTISQKEMKKNRLTIDELWIELRKQSIIDLSTVKHAILETDGTLSVLLSPDYAPATPRQLNLPTETSEYPIIVVSDGRTLSENLKVLGLDGRWLQKELNNQNIKSPKEVFLMTVTSDKKIFLQKKEEAK